MKGVKTQENSGHLWHLDMVLLEKRRGRLQGVTKVMMDEEEEDDKEEEEDSWSMERLSTSAATCPQTDLQRCALEILAGVKRPTTVKNTTCQNLLICTNVTTSIIPHHHDDDAT